MNHHDDFKKAIKKIDSQKCESLFREFAVTEGWWDIVVTDLKESGVLCIPRHNESLKRKVDALIKLFRNLLSTNSVDILSEFENHVKDAHIVNDLLVEVLERVKNSPLGKIESARQVWGLLARTYSEWASVELDIQREMKVHAHSYGFVDISSIGISEPERIVLPEAIHYGLFRSVGMTMTMLAYENSWFENAGIAKLPNSTSCTAEESGLISCHIVYSVMWERIYEAWDRARFFETALSSKKSSIGGCQIFTSSDPSSLEIADSVAKNRLIQMHFSHREAIERKPDEELRIMKVRENSEIPLAPHAFVSKDECVSYNLLSNLCCLPIEDREEIAHGLPLAVWLRGYAILKLLADEAPPNACLPVNEAEVARLLFSCGLTRSEAEKFIEAAKFQTQSRDLIDTPLLELASGDLVLYTLALKGGVLAAIVLSRLSSANAQHRDINAFGGKGKRFEESVLAVFKKNKIPAASFKYRVDGRWWECDAVIVVDDTVFVFECKNYSLPMGHIASIYYFNKKLSDSRSQVERISKQLKENPDILRSYFPSLPNDFEVIPVVLHSLPWADRTTEGACVYDYSALVKLFDEGKISIRRMTPQGSRGDLCFSLWKAGRPTAVELLENLRNPIQLVLSERELAWKKMHMCISERISIAFPTIVSIEYPISERRDELARRYIVWRSPVDALLARRKRNRRNELCHCSSGKKYKKCCLKVEFFDRLPTREL